MFEGRRVQIGPEFRIDALLLLFADYSSPAQAVGNQSRRDRKDYFHVQLAVHCDVTGPKDSGSLLGQTPELNDTTVPGGLN